jgi:hypothetical protein
MLPSLSISARTTRLRHLISQLRRLDKLQPAKILGVSLNVDYLVNHAVARRIAPMRQVATKKHP